MKRSNLKIYRKNNMYRNIHLLLKCKCTYITLCTHGAAYGIVGENIAVNNLELTILDPDPK